MINELYQPAKSIQWSGRIDSTTDPEQFRFHQVVACIPLSEISPRKEVALLGFASDEGVRRNQGRLGAAGGPDYFRESIGSLCWHGLQQGFLDVGNIMVKEKNLESAQKALGWAVQHLLKHQKTPFVIGGGHETAYGHYLGVAEFLSKHHAGAKLGILNIDAHFDLRPHNGHPHSGSSFLQASEHAANERIDLRYFVYGINPWNNTRSLFKTAKKLNAQYCTNTQIFENETKALEEVYTFLETRTHIYLTVCLDVFDAAAAPGVSAPAWNGIALHHALKVIEAVKQSGKLVSMDVCELNPEYDEHRKTAKLAGMLFTQLFR